MSISSSVSATIPLQRNVLPLQLLQPARVLAKLFDPAEVDWALGQAAVHGRFADADLASIPDHHASRPSRGEHHAGEDRNLTEGTRGWAALGQPSQ